MNTNSDTLTFLFCGPYLFPNSDLLSNNILVGYPMLLARNSNSAILDLLSSSATSFSGTSIIYQHSELCLLLVLP